MDNKGKAYYDKLLDQYIDGTISAEDRFALEKHALDDPFLFEALAGLQNKDGTNFKSIENLESKINQQSQEKRTRRIPLFNYGIAASLILLLGVGLWMFNATNNNTDTVAMNATVASEAKTEEKTFDNDVKELSSPPPQEQEMPAKKLKTKNQYDTPKAVISQTDNEGLEFEATQADLAASDKQPDKTKIILINPRPDNEDSSPSDGGSSIVSKPTAAVSISEVQESEPLLDQYEVQSSDERLAENIIVVDQANEEKVLSKRRSTDDRINASAIRSELNKTEYIASLDKNILVAPPKGITAFQSNVVMLDEDDQLINNDGLAPMIQFRITTEGKPYDLSIINGKANECLDKVSKEILNGENWITIPKNSAATIQLKIPCF